ncbi:OB domain-containing protein [Plasmodiophora brassicae]|nr:hypothetical protein PBRA_006256 [Plasmodiophora brassicae]
MRQQELPFSYWGLQSTYWSFVRILICDIYRLGAFREHPGCSFSLCGRPIQRVCIVGVIVEARLHATNLVVMIDDGTGIISATYWFNEPGSCADHLALGNRVLVHGRLSTYRNEPQIQITSSGILHDPNAEVLHWIQAVHLYQTVYSQPDAVADSVRRTIESSAPSFTSAQSTNLPSTASDDLRKCCMRLFSHGNALAFADICNDDNVVMKAAATLNCSASPNDIALAVARAIAQCVARGHLIQVCEGRDEYMLLDAKAHLADPIVQILRHQNQITVSQLRSQLCSHPRYRGVSLESIKEAIRYLQSLGTVSLDSTNKYITLLSYAHVRVAS